MTDSRHHISSVVTRAWADEAFKARFLADPLAVLKAEGIEVPTGPALHFLENSDTLAHLVQPARPASQLFDDGNGSGVGHGGGQRSSL